MRTRLDVDLRHDPVDLHPRDQPDEPVAGTREDVRGIGCRTRELDGTLGERVAGDLGRGRIGGRQQALVDPAPDRVVAHTEQPSGFCDLVGGHGTKVSPRMRVT